MEPNFHISYCCDNDRYSNSEAQVQDKHGAGFAKTGELRTCRLSDSRSIGTGHLLVSRLRMLSYRNSVHDENAGFIARSHTKRSITIVNSKTSKTSRTYTGYGWRLTCIKAYFLPMKGVKTLARVSNVRTRHILQPHQASSHLSADHKVNHNKNKVRTSRSARLKIMFIPHETIAEPIRKLKFGYHRMVHCHMLFSSRRLCVCNIW